LARDLESEGVKVWIYEAEMLIGDSLFKKVEQAIREMDYLGVVLSPNSIQSEWVQKEVEIALGHEIQGKRVKVLPILYKECNIPDFLTGKVWGDFSKPRSYRAGLDVLLRRLADTKSVDTRYAEASGQLVGFRVLNWNIGGRLFLELPRHQDRAAIRERLNNELRELIHRYEPDAVTLQEIVQYGTGRNNSVDDLIDPIPGYTYHPVPLIDSFPYTAKAKWNKVLRQGDWSPDTYFAQGNAFLFREDAPLTSLWDLSKPESVPTNINRELAIEKIDLSSGLYLGDRDTEPRVALVSHLVCFPKGTSDGVREKPFDVFLINVQLSILTGEREGSPSIDALASSRRKSQLDVIFNGIVSRYNEWRQAGYPLRGQRREPMMGETFDRQTPMWILSGSFNFTPDSEEYGIIKRMNFVDTVPSKGTGTKSKGAGRQPILTLDYIFAGPRFVAMDLFIQEKTLGKNRVDPSTKVSDHYPMIAAIPLEVP